MSHRARRLVAVSAVGAVLAAGTLAFAATSRFSSVKPPGSICLGKSFEVGVRFRGGSKRSYSVKVIQPNAVVIFSVKGRAKKAWRRWSVRPRVAGSHRVNYVLGGKRRGHAVSVMRCDPGVRVTDNDGGTAALSLENARPGQTASSCIVVTYNATRAGPMRLYGTTTGTGLDRYLDVVVTRGKVPTGSAFGDCDGFVADTSDHIGEGAGVVYRGSLEGFPDSYAAGLTAPAALWVNGESHAFRFDVSLTDDDEAQGLTTDQTFTWEARL